MWNRLEYRLHPDTRKRASRLRDPSEHKIAAVPHLRIVPDDLWQAVKTRQDAHDVKRAERIAKGAKGLSQIQGVRKIKYLLSGLLRCGRCGGYLTIAGSGDKRYYCSDSKQKGSAICEGQPGIRQEEAERRVLAGLQRHLLTDAAYAAFKARVDTEAAVLEERANGEIRRVEDQVAEAREAVNNLVAAMAKGRTSTALFDALEKAEAQLATWEAKRAEMTPVVFDLPRVYRG